MSIDKIVNENTKNVVISIDGRFDFTFHREFRDSYTSCVQPGSTFTLKLGRTSYMDSSALGMILLLKDHADQLKGKVVISQPSATVSKILQIAQFHKLFTIE
jgi:anti-anti-sigma factor